MRTVRRWNAAIVAVALVGCASSAAGSSTSDPGPPSDAAANATTVDLADDAGTTSTTSAASTTSTASTTATSTVVAPTTTTSTTVQNATDADPSTPGDDVDDDPSFELGPDIVLDVDVARFPVDDAGVGGAVPSTVEEAEDAVEASTTGWAGFDASIEAALIRPGNTAASVAVSIGGDIVHRAAFGVRDPESGDPAGPEDRFRVASISKTITAITLMRLVEAGAIGLDDPVGQLVADRIGLDGVGASGALTIRQLLTHRTGFGKFQSTFFRGGASSCEDAAAAGLRSGAAGGGYVYSNMNYCIAGLAIEAITGESYEQAVYRLLLTPLGISGMRLAPTVDPGPGETQHVTTPGRNYMETLGAAGAWIASPTDLVTIMDSLDVSTDGFKPLSAETVLQMVAPVGGALGQRGYGYGVISYGGNRFGHTGTIESTHAMVLDRGDDVVWAVTVAGQIPGESTDLERIVNAAFAAGGFVAG